MGRLPLLLCCLATWFASWAATDASHYEGSRMPYPAPPEDAWCYPDSLTPVMVNHVGRHGSRFPTSRNMVLGLRDELLKARDNGTLTVEGKCLLTTTLRAVETIDGRWGALDSLGMAEQAQIAARMALHFPQLFQKESVEAVASQVARCRMSMYSFVHRLSESYDSLEVRTSSGPEYAASMRPFTTDSAYLRYRAEEPYRDLYKSFCLSHAPLEVADAIFGVKEREEALRLVEMVYYLVSTLNAMGMAADYEDYFTTEQYRAMWECDNLRQYLTRCANVFSPEPSAIASLLLLELLTTTENAVCGADFTPVMLRFGHAETLMPLLSLMKLPGCYYEGTDWENLEDVWATWRIVPMAANLQLILFRSATGRYYLRTDLNEIPTPLVEGSDEIYVPWDRAAKRLADLLFP